MDGFRDNLCGHGGKVKLSMEDGGFYMDDRVYGTIIVLRRLVLLPPRMFGYNLAGEGTGYGKVGTDDKIWLQKG